MKSVLILIAVVAFLALNDLYAFRGIATLAGSSQTLKTFSLVYWGISFAVLISMVWAGTAFRNMRNPSVFMAITVIMGIFLMLYLPRILFNAFQLLGDLIALVAGWIGGNGPALRRWFLVPGAFLGLALCVAFAEGMLRGRTHVKVYRETIALNDLPESFDGFRIVQLSDFHLAGFYFSPGHIEKVVSMVNELQPDLILFTGDMVHNFSDELVPFTGILNRLEAPGGKYAILGNHDYGQYYRWASPEAKEKNLQKTKELIRLSGFDLLLNEHRTVSVNGESLEIIGVENWGKPPFPQFGDLDRAMEGTRPGRIKILLSHDPSHWDLKIRGREPVALTLSGHTHGMQFGIEAGNFRWSPSAWTYRYWGGLYSGNGQYLYVNRGIGFTGFPGRVGIRPEITLLTLTAG